MTISDVILEDLHSLAGILCNSLAERNENWYMWAEESEKPQCAVKVCYAKDAVYVPQAWTELHFATPADAKAWLAQALLANCVVDADTRVISTQFDESPYIGDAADRMPLKLGRARFEMANAESVI